MHLINIEIIETRACCFMISSKFKLFHISVFRKFTEAFEIALSRRHDQLLSLVTCRHCRVEILIG